MKLALWQTAPTNGRIEAVFSAVCSQLRAAAAAGAKLLVAPELVLPGYNRPDLHAALAQPLDGEWITRLRDLARETGCGICLGWAERAGAAEPAAVYNAATAIGPDGAILAHYRKIQLFGPMESASFARGDQLCPVFEIEGRRAAMLICYDIEFPGHAAALAQAGARLILVPTANPTGFEHVQNRLVPARAHENNATVAYANLCGSENGLSFGGRSLIAGPDGEPLAQAGARGEALLVVDLAAADAVPEELRGVVAQEYRPARG
ncbi:nitrilase-related carbon-nitrogen hydrolase [Paracoccus aminophilus]|uniref:R-amidase n=1 Tax=Paracoccus aminophilus JCM 7686 TaxID=1367847 RepID=S5Y229_PARAH|nr:nitrilase-related carbon-nitrogen hydrolase [Paracoccus aminophilus]AGT09795.1 R-amidase [Paracoccus aminophilus JCM 7686]